MRDSHKKSPASTFLVRICASLSAFMVAAGVASVFYLVAFGRDNAAVIAVPITFFVFALLFAAVALLSISRRGKFGFRFGGARMKVKTSAEKKLRSNRNALQRAEREKANAPALPAVAED